MCYVTELQLNFRGDFAVIELCKGFSIHSRNSSNFGITVFSTKTPMTVEYSFYFFLKQYGLSKVYVCLYVDFLYNAR